MKTTSPLSILLCCVFFASSYTAVAQTEKPGKNKETTESKAAAERAFDAVVQEDKKSNLALTYRPRGTGQTTGHIATITVENVGSNPVQLVATGETGLDALAFIDEDITEVSDIFGSEGRYEDGKIDLESSMGYIPSDGKHQSYVATESKWPPGISQTLGTPNDNGQTPITTIGPGESVVIPIHGYCAEIHAPPVPAGESMTPVSNWVSPGEAMFPEPDEFEKYGVQTVAAPIDGGPYLANIAPDIDPGPGQTMALGRKTDPNVTAAFLFHAVSRITITTDILQDAGLISTPFSGVSDKERESVIQQTLWLYSSVLTDNIYTKDDFSDRMTTQYEENTGTKLKNATSETQESLEKGVDDFWNSFNLVGAEAKVLKDAGANQVTIPPDVKDKLENALGKHDTSGVKAKTGETASDAADAVGAEGYAVGDGVAHSDESTDPELIGHEAAHVVQQGGATTPNTVDLDDVEKKEDFDNWRRKKYDDYVVEREINGKSHKEACKRIGVDPDSDLGKALKRVYKKEKNN